MVAELVEGASECENLGGPTFSQRQNRTEGVGEGLLQGVSRIGIGPILRMRVYRAQTSQDESKPNWVKSESELKHRVPLYFLAHGNNMIFFQGKAGQRYRILKTYWLFTAVRHISTSCQKH